MIGEGEVITGVGGVLVRNAVNGAVGIDAGGDLIGATGLIGEGEVIAGIGLAGVVFLTSPASVKQRELSGTTTELIECVIGLLELGGNPGQLLPVDGVDVVGTDGSFGDRICGDSTVDHGLGDAGGIGHRRKGHGRQFESVPEFVAVDRQLKKDLTILKDRGVQGVFIPAEYGRIDPVVIEVSGHLIAPQQIAVGGGVVQRKFQVLGPRHWLIAIHDSALLGNADRDFSHRWQRQ